MKYPRGMKAMWGLWKRAASSWSDDRATMIGAAMAYYTVFSIAPLLIISIAVAGAVFGSEATQGEIFRSLEGLVGPQGAQGIQALVQAAANKPRSGLIASVVGGLTLAVGASGVFSQLQEALNIVWRVKPAPHAGWWQWLRRRILSFSMVLVIAFLLLVSLVASAAVTAAGNYLSHVLPGGEALWQVVNLALGFAVVTALFGAIYKVLPDVILSWRDVGVGAAATALLFSAGRFLIGAYLGRGSVASAYGAAGSLVVLLLWVFYSSCILLLGAEFTHAYATHGGRRIRLRPGAVWAEDPMAGVAQREPAPKPSGAAA